MQMRPPVARSTTDESLSDLRMPIGQERREENCAAESGNCDGASVVIDRYVVSFIVNASARHMSCACTLLANGASGGASISTRRLHLHAGPDRPQ